MVKDTGNTLINSVRGPWDPFHDNPGPGPPSSFDADPDPFLPPKTWPVNNWKILSFT